MISKLREITKSFKNELSVYRRAIKDKRTPLIAKLFLSLALGYLLLPFDIIPDVIPVLGQLDDVLIVPLLVLLAVSFIPKHLLVEYRKENI